MHWTVKNTRKKAQKGIILHPGQFPPSLSSPSNSWAVHKTEMRPQDISVAARAKRIGLSDTASLLQLYSSCSKTVRKRNSEAPAEEGSQGCPFLVQKQVLGPREGQSPSACSRTLPGPWRSGSCSPPQHPAAAAVLRERLTPTHRSEISVANAASLALMLHDRAEPKRLFRRAFMAMILQMLRTWEKTQEKRERISFSSFPRIAPEQ